MMSTPPILAASRLWDTSGALSDTVTIATIILVVACIIIAPLIVLFGRNLNRISTRVADSIRERYRTWLVIAPALLVPILISCGTAIIAFAIFSLLCYREFARATGLFRWRGLSGLVAIAIIAINFAAMDNWYNFFLALPPLCIAVFASLSVLADEPRGYLQRVGLASFAFLFIGVGLGHLSFLANADRYRPLTCIILVCTQLTDILTYFSAALLDTAPTFRQTTKGKTIAGHIIPFLVIAPLAAVALHVAARNTPVDTFFRVSLFGILMALCAQLGDLIICSIKRDIGLKDMAGTLPGHGGFLDRFNAVLLAAPVAFHYLKYFDALDLDLVQRLFSH